MPKNIEVSIPYKPRPIQAQLHRQLKRFNVLVAHRRFGKTVFCINELIDRALYCELDNPRFAYMAPYFTQAKDVAWAYLKYYAGNLPHPDVATNKNYKPALTNESELRLEFINAAGKKAQIRIYGADNAERLRGLYYDGIILDEYAQMRPSVWPEIVRPALADRHGWAIFIGTPQGRNAFWELYDGAINGFMNPEGQRRPRDSEWFGAMYKASETHILPAAELEAARQTMTPEQYEQEFECSFQAAILGAYYGKEIAWLEAEARINNVPHDPALQVITAWDLGIGDSTAIWFAQQISNEIRIIDFYEASGVGLDHYVKILKDKPYIYQQHILPHDVQIRELATGKSRVETLRSLGLSNIKILPAYSVDDGINAARLMLKKCWFDNAKCGQGLEALRQYRVDFDEKTKTFKKNPRHDWASHAADAFRYLAMGITEQTTPFHPSRYYASHMPLKQTAYNPLDWTGN